MEIDDLPPVLTAEHVAQLLQMNVDYVRKLTRDGVIPAHRFPVGRTLRYLTDEVVPWLRALPGPDIMEMDTVTPSEPRRRAGAGEQDRESIRLERSVTARRPTRPGAWRQKTRGHM